MIDAVKEFLEKFLFGGYNWAIYSRGFLLLFLMFFSGFLLVKSILALIPLIMSFIGLAIMDNSPFKPLN